MTRSSQTLVALLEKNATMRARHPFLRMTGLELSYAEFNAGCNRIAHGLRRLGITRGQLVGLMLPNSLEFMHVWLALSKLGAVEAPVNTAFRGAGLAHMLNLTESPYLIVHEMYLDAIEAIADRLDDITFLVVCGDAAAAARRFPRWDVRPFSELESDESDNPGVAVAPEDLAMLLFTSGTTGRSKACMLPHNYAVRQGELFAEHYRFRPDDVLYCPYPLFHIDAAVCTVAAAMVCGATAALGERFSVSRFWAEIRQFGGTVFDFMGATLTMLWKQPPTPDDANNPVRLAWGVPMPEFADEFEDRFGLKLIENYGSTDAGVPVFYPYDEPRRRGACGKVIDAYQLMIADDADDECPAGQSGEILVRPNEPSLMADGYYRMPEATISTRRNLWFHTGDLGYMDKEGFLYFLGRKKEMIRRRGENISTFEIEEVINEHPAVFEVAAVGVPSDLTDEEIKVCIVLRPNAELSPAALIEYCTPRMARFMLPRYIEFLPELPKTPTLKIEKYRLQEAGITSATWDRERADATN